MAILGIETLTNDGPTHVLVLVMKPISYARHRFPPDVIRHSVWLYLRFTLSYRDVEDLLAERGLTVSNDSNRRWVSISGRSSSSRLLSGNLFKIARAATLDANNLMIRVGSLFRK